VSPSVRHLLTLLIQLGPIGLFLLSVADSSFLLVPIGNDLLTVLLVARNHDRFVICVVSAAVGSVIGVFLLDVVCRRLGEKGLARLVKPKLLAYLRGRLERHAAVALFIACLAPPPFPFSASIAVASALQYPRTRLLTIVLAMRALRFTLVGWAAIHFGRRILRIAQSTEFLWAISIFIAICIIGSVFSIARWIRIGRA